MKVTKIIIHNTGGIESDANFSTINHTADQVNIAHKKWDMKSSLGYWGGYTLFIDKNGIATQFRKIGEEGAHSRGSNFEIGICLAGNFSNGVDSPTHLQKMTLKKIMKALLDGNPGAENLIVKDGVDIDISLSNIIPHRRAQTGRTCYGTNLDDFWAQRLVQDDVEEIEKLKAQLRSLLIILRDILLARTQLRGVGDSCSLTDNRG